MRTFLMGLTLLLAAAAVTGQTRQRLITGLITSADDGVTLEGAAVWVKGTKNYSGSQPDGIYYLPVTPRDSVLVFFHEGFDLQEIHLNHETEYNVQLRRTARTAQNKRPEKR